MPRLAKDGCSKHSFNTHGSSQGMQIPQKPKTKLGVNTIKALQKISQLGNSIK